MFQQTSQRRPQRELLKLKRKMLILKSIKWLSKMRNYLMIWIWKILIQTSFARTLIKTRKKIT